MAAAHALGDNRSGNAGSSHLAFVDRGSATVRLAGAIGGGGALGFSLGAIAGGQIGAVVGTGLGMIAGLAGGAAVGRRAAVPRGPRPVDPFTINDPWRQLLGSAQRSQRAFAEVTETVEEGPIRDYLARTGRQLDDAVADIGTIAVTGNRLDASTRSLDPTRLRSKLDREIELQRAESTGAERDPHRAASIASLQAQLASVDRLKAQSASTESELRTRVTQLGELVANATEVSVGALPQSRFDSDVSELVDSLQSLRQASEELPSS